MEWNKKKLNQIARRKAAAAAAEVCFVLSKVMKIGSG